MSRGPGSGESGCSHAAMPPRACLLLHSGHDEFWADSCGCLLAGLSGGFPACRSWHNRRGQRNGRVPAVAARSKKGPLADRIAAILADPALSHAEFGISVTTLDGQPLYGLNRGAAVYSGLEREAHHHGRGLCAAAGGDALMDHERGGRRRCGLSAGVLHGDLILLGVGDPTISARHIPIRSRAPRRQPRRDCGQPPIDTTASAPPTR